MPHARGGVGDTVRTVEAQREWIAAYLERDGDAYFIVETEAKDPVGTAGIYEIAGATAEWGRWIMLPGVPAALPSAILIHDLAFNGLKLTELRGCVVSTNTPVLSFHRRFGSEITGTEHNARQIGGSWIDLIWLRIRSEQWPEIRRRTLPLALAAQRSLLLDVPKR